jgi:hypothetical protein
MPGDHSLTLADHPLRLGSHPLMPGDHRLGFGRASELGVRRDGLVDGASLGSIRLAAISGSRTPTLFESMLFPEFRTYL